MREKLYRHLFALDTAEGRRTNRTIMLLIVLSVLISMLGTLEGISATAHRWIMGFDYAVSVLFAIEYALRLYAARDRLAYAFGFNGIVDLATFLPVLLFQDPTLAVRLLRVLRLLKLVRYLRALKLFLSSLRDVFDIMLAVSFAIFLVVLISGNLVYFLEPEHFHNAFYGVWWALVTMTTVGYGDIVPLSFAGKAVASALMILGLTLFAMLTGTISVKIAHVLSYHRDCRRCKRRISEEFIFCPYCGAPQDGD